MSDDLQAVEVVFVSSDPSETEALLSYLKSLGSADGTVAVEDLAVAAALGAFKTEKVITFVLAFSGSIATGVIGNAVYDALKSAVTAQCVIAGEPIDKTTAADKAKLEAKVRAGAQPRGARIAGH